MKTLEFDQMEQVEGGDFWRNVSCGGAVLGVVALGIVAFTTPVGAFTAAIWGPSVLGAITTGAAGAACLY